ncbi:MAG: C39 family peptidase [Elusimicrobiaceae bacterium]|nr:C39 family peptidase [Elusimicrobiaceae bacterium]
MNCAAVKLPYLTFSHRPCRGYELSGDGAEHIILSPVLESPVSFSSLVLSVDFVAKGQDWLMSEVQICQNEQWSPFYKLAIYSQKLNHSFDEQEDEFAKVCVDVLQLKQPAQAYRFRLTIGGEASLPKVTVCLTDAQARYDVCDALLPEGKKEIEVKPISQMRLNVTENDRVRLCSPTSLTMALNTLGIAADPLQTAESVYDEKAAIYGNWTFNTAYACQKGADAFVTRFQRLSQLKEFVNKNSLVLASIAFKRGELQGSAVRQTPGHLVLICGWNDGKIRVADPAASLTKEVIRYYNAEEFARAWLVRKRGLAYIVRKK